MYNKYFPDVLASIAMVLRCHLRQPANNGGVFQSHEHSSFHNRVKLYGNALPVRIVTDSTIQGLL